MTGREPAAAPRRRVAPVRDVPGSAERRSSGAPLRVVRSASPRLATDAARLARRDLLLLSGSAGFLTVAGLVMVLSAGSVSAAQGYEGNSFWYFQRQAMYALAGLATAVVVAKAPPQIWKVVSPPLLGFTALLMLVAAHPASGTSLYGASRWIDLGPVTLQPSEFAKLGLMTFGATVLANKWGQIEDLRHLLIPLGPVVVVVAILGVAQRDLGTTVILCGSMLLLLFVAGVRLRYLALAGMLGFAASAYLIVGETYRRARFFEAWLDPWATRDTSGYQLVQGMIAFGSGGWLGTGLGTSRAKWDFLPNAHSDFIFAVIGEELGMVGAIVILIAFGVVIWAGIRIAVHATGTFERLLAAGVVSWIGLQTVINLGAVTGLLPITGVPLPLVSFGGTALVVTLAGVGVLASVARASGRAAKVPSGSGGTARRPTSPRKARR